MAYRFFALISRMRYIQRWGLMRNTFQENIQEHSHMVAVLAHGLALINREILGGGAIPTGARRRRCSTTRRRSSPATCPPPSSTTTPISRDAYKQVESVSCRKLLAMLPEKLQPAYEPLLLESEPEVRRIVKAADKLSATSSALRS